MPSSRGSYQPSDQNRSPELQHVLYHLSHQGSPRILERVAHLFCKMGSVTLTPQSFEYLELGLADLWKTGACYLTDKIQLMKSEWLISQVYENGKGTKGQGPECNFSVSFYNTVHIILWLLSSSLWTELQRPFPVSRWALGQLLWGSPLETEGIWTWSIKQFICSARFSCACLLFPHSSSVTWFADWNRAYLLLKLVFPIY